MNIEPIAYFRSPFLTKFGVPRQSCLVDGLRGRVDFVAKYAQREALRGLDEFDYIWLVWGFSANVSAAKHATVRPPLFGGNERIGVWATRSSFRPNNLALSSVRIACVDMSRPSIEVLGADLMDGTPIYDIKPYLPQVDCHPEAHGGFTDRRSWQMQPVEFAPEVGECLSPSDLAVLRDVLALDPRPRYHHDNEREYGMPFMGWDVRFKVSSTGLVVTKIGKL